MVSIEENISLYKLNEMRIQIIKCTRRSLIYSTILKLLYLFFNNYFSYWHTVTQYFDFENI